MRRVSTLRDHLPEPLSEKKYDKLKKKMEKRLEEAEEVLEDHEEVLEEYLEETDGGQALGGLDGVE